jgi:hypothetical protein
MTSDSLHGWTILGHSAKMSFYSGILYDKFFDRGVSLTIMLNARTAGKSENVNVAPRAIVREADAMTPCQYVSRYLVYYQRKVSLRCTWSCHHRQMTLANRRSLFSERS